MNCVNHPENAVAAYCQNCGKALCATCVRSVAGVIYCEQCLADRLGMGAAGPASGPASGPVAGAAYPPPVGVIAPEGPSPGVAFALGFIPGVGAMYNGQFIKGLVHVLVFVILIGITEDHGIFGVFIAAWIAYQVFDAYQTARARREGYPLPDPFGLNDLGAKLGLQQHGYGVSAVPPPGAGSGFPPPPAAGFTPVSGFAPPAAGFNEPYGAPYSAVPPVPGPGPGFDPNFPPPPRRRREPVGAMVLIGLGVLFLLNTMNVFRFDWIGHLWPLLLIGFGAALFIQRSKQLSPLPPPPPPPGPSSAPPSSGGEQQ